MRKEEDEDQRVRNLFREITKLLPERSKIKTDLLYFKYAPILVMLFRWYSVSQFYDSKMEITLWYEENEEPIWYHLHSLPDFSLERSGTAQIVRGVENTALICSRVICRLLNRLPTAAARNRTCESVRWFQ